LSKAVDLISFGGSWSTLPSARRLPRPTIDPVGEEIQLIEKLQVQEDRTRVESARGDLAAVRLLELAHRVGKLAFEKRRVVSVNLGQGA